MKINRLSECIAAAAVFLISVSAVESSVRADEDPPSDPRIKKGFEIAPVPLNLAGKDYELVGLGSYLVNAEMNKEWGPKGIHVYYVPDLYFKEKELMKEVMRKHGWPIDEHGGTDDTSETLYIDKMVNGPHGKWIRSNKLVNGLDGDGTGVIGDQTKATLEMGRMFTDAKVTFAVNQIRQLMAAGK